jgi:heat-inducible transcriptional repressor
MSPATVRNELALLTEMNFLRQPHTSAGRIPTELGYRYFVGVLMRTQELSEATRRMIEHQFYQTQQEQGIDGWMKLSASILASLSHAVSLVSAHCHSELS